jgi:hypothetical protein
LKAFQTRRSRPIADKRVPSLLHLCALVRDDKE